MKFHSKKNSNSALNCRKAFSLLEVMAALSILALVCSSVLVVINRCMTSTANSALRMQAFEVARNNMEKLLTSDSVKEMLEYGNSDKYLEIQWQTTVESFYEPLTSRMWIKAVCSAEYADTAGEEQTVELTHWLTDLTKKDVLKIIEQQQREKEWLAEQGEDEQGQEEGEPKQKQAEPGDEKQGEPETDDGEPEPDKKIYTPEDLREMGVPEELIPIVLPLLNS